MQKTTKTKPFEKKKKTTSLQKTENLSPLRKNPLTKKHTILAEKATLPFLKNPLQKFKPLRLKKKKPFQKNMNPSPGEKKRKKRTPLKRKKTLKKQTNFKKKNTKKNMKKT